jgi:hypothetical protein
MPTTETIFSQVRKIDNNRAKAPLATLLCVAFLIFLAFWFFQGNSFRLYASLFFGLYYLTNLSWLSIILVSVVQNIFFLPLRLLYERFYVDLKDFENELDKSKADDQYFILNRHVREGNLSVIFYILNFVILLIAFVSAGRVFLLEFYHTPINPSWLYSQIPYPNYPLNGVVFNFPFFKVTQTMALDWWTIFYIWAIPVSVLVVFRLLWLILRPLLTRNHSILRFRIGINRLKLLISGFAGTLLILSLFFFRHIPTDVQFYYLSADLSKQNTVFNIITAVCTMLAAVYSGVQHSQEAAKEARKLGIPENIITKVSHQTIRTSFGNGILLGLLALWLTRLMPCSHDLSVLAFEFLYVISPLTFDLLIPKSKHRDT